MFRKEVVPVECYKTPLAALFAFLKVDREQAYKIIQLLEAVDPELTYKLSVKAFAARYCKTCTTPLLVIFYNYSLASQTSSDKRQGYTSSRQFSRQKQSSEEMTAQFSRIIDSCTYFDMICFILHFLTIPDSRMVEMLYWMAFVGQQKPISENELLNLFDALYGDQLNAQVASVMNARKKIADLCKTVDMDGLTAYRLQIMDVRTGGFYTKVLLNVKRAIVNSTFGSSFWKRITDSFHHVISHMEENYMHLERLPFHRQHAWNEFVINGERRLARKEIRRFVRIMADFRRMETAEKEQSSKGYRVEGMRVLKFFSNVLRVFPSRSSHAMSSSQSVDFASTSTSMAAMVMEKLFGRRQDDDMLDDRETEEQEVVSLEAQYGAALEMTIDELQGDAANWENDARKALFDCEELLAMGADMHSEVASIASHRSKGSLHSRGSTIRTRLRGLSTGSLRSMGSLRSHSSTAAMRTGRDHGGDDENGNGESGATEMSGSRSRKSSFHKEMVSRKASITASRIIEEDEESAGDEDHAGGDRSHHEGEPIEGEEEEGEGDVHILDERGDDDEASVEDGKGDPQESNDSAQEKPIPASHSIDDYDPPDDDELFK